jgi:hypothetical protein
MRLFMASTRNRVILSTMALVLLSVAGWSTKARAQGTPITVQGKITANPEPSEYGQGFSVAAALDVPTGDPTATGTMTFLIDGNLIGTSPLVNGLANLSATIPTLAVGTHSLEAEYSGDANYAAVTFSGPHVVVQATSSLTIQDITTPLEYGQTLNGEAIIVGPTDGGTIDFYIDGVDVCTLPLTSGPPEVCPANAGSGYGVGTHTFSATYSGDTDYAGSSSPVYTFVVVAADTTAELTSSLNPSTVGQAVTFTMQVTAAGVTPTGTVTFYDGTTAIGTGTLNGQGVATLTTSTLTAGTHDISAQYAATTNFNASTSNTVAQVVNPASTPPPPPPPPPTGPDFQLVVTPTTVPIDVGLIATVTVQAVENNGLSEPVSLTCSGLPKEASCTFESSVLPAGGGTTTLTLYSGAPHDCGTPPTTFLGPLSGGLGALSLLTLLGLPFARGRKRLRSLLLAALLAVVLPAINSCSGHCTDFAVKPGTYHFTITAATTGSAHDSATQAMTMKVSF